MMDFLPRIESGEFDHEWFPLPATDDLTIYVSKDALKVDGIRINVSAYQQQQIADRIGAMLLTTWVSDLIWRKGDQITPSPRSISASYEAMVAHSKEVDRKLSAVRNPVGLATNTGKHWVLDNLQESLNFKYQKYAPRLYWAINYGWYLSSGGDPSPNDPKLRLIQTRGTFHDFNHWDYSQTATFMHQVARYKGQDVPLETLLREEGPWGEGLRIFRVPGVPVYTGPVILPETRIVYSDGPGVLSTVKCEKAASQAAFF